MGISFAKPTPLSKAGIKEVVGQFLYVAEVAYRTGYVLRFSLRSYSQAEFVLKL